MTEQPLQSYQNTAQPCTGSSSTSSRCSSSSSRGVPTSTLPSTPSTDLLLSHRSIPPSQPLILAWPPSPSISSTNKSIEPPTPTEAPPGLVAKSSVKMKQSEAHYHDFGLKRYDIATAPTNPVKYQFSNIGSNSMVLLPPADALNTQPLYHISVSLDCFVPFSYITTVVRGGSPNGEVVGDFETGSLVNPAIRESTIFVRDQEHRLKDLVSHVGAMHWTWKPSRRDQALGKPQLEWDFSRPRSQIFSCKLLQAPKILLAIYSPPSFPRRQRGGPPQPSTLEVTPQGYEHLDEVLLSLLVIERERHLRMDL
ncbi:hypothetical protein NP233_g6301 [Leucocoprinus birnbaumii]|uniref:Uncharacterized protein n=1 Tax=Leucocoprinus birnbaumii TaxID=56174 RepID=A0AAD5VUR9_9AGAR|nr:hypothetical protein NP233_g6301 [Leucocoprinus birnbaumii]